MVPTGNTLGFVHVNVLPMWQVGNVDVSNLIANKDLPTLSHQSAVWAAPTRSLSLHGHMTASYRYSMRQMSGLRSSLLNSSDGAVCVHGLTYNTLWHAVCESADHCMRLGMRNDSSKRKVSQHLGSIDIGVKVSENVKDWSSQRTDVLARSELWCAFDAQCGSPIPLQASRTRSRIRFRVHECVLAKHSSTSESIVFVVNE